MWPELPVRMWNDWLWYDYSLLGNLKAAFIFNHVSGFSAALTTGSLVKWWGSAHFGIQVLVNAAVAVFICSHFLSAVLVIDSTFFINKHGFYNDDWIWTCTILTDLRLPLFSLSARWTSSFSSWWIQCLYKPFSSLLSLCCSLCGSTDSTGVLLLWALE